MLNMGDYGIVFDFPATSRRHQSVSHEWGFHMFNRLDLFTSRGRQDTDLWKTTALLPDCESELSEVPG
jgi:hypothetical protein